MISMNLLLLEWIWFPESEWSKKYYTIKIKKTIQSHRREQIIPERSYNKIMTYAMPAYGDKTSKIFTDTSTLFLIFHQIW